MGKNTMDRQNFIIDNLRVEKDIIEEKEVAWDWRLEARG
jgi:hypothetical protein